MAREDFPQERHFTYEEARAKYIAEQERESDSPAPWGGERERRFYAAYEGVDAVFGVLRAHKTVQRLSDGRSGILSKQQLQAIENWHLSYLGIIQLNHDVLTTMNKGIAFGLVEGQIADLEEIATKGLELFERPEARQ